MEEGRVLTVEEALALPPPTEEELARRRVAMRAFLTEVDRQRAAYLARGGRLMTEEEWQEFWDHRWDDDEDWPAK